MLLENVEGVRRASFSVVTAASSSSISASAAQEDQSGAECRSARASFSRSTAAIDEALMNIDWSPCLGGSGSSFSMHGSRSSVSVSRSPTTSLVDALTPPVPASPQPSTSVPTTPEIIISIADTGKCNRFQCTPLLVFVVWPLKQHSLIAHKEMTRAVSCVSTRLSVLEHWSWLSQWAVKKGLCSNGWYSCRPEDFIAKPDIKPAGRWSLSFFFNYWSKILRAWFLKMQESMSKKRWMSVFAGHGFMWPQTETLWRITISQVEVRASSFH